MASKDSKKIKEEPQKATVVPASEDKVMEKPNSSHKNKEKKQVSSVEKPASTEMAEKVEKKEVRAAGRKKIRRMCPEALVTVKADFNNTIVTITDLKGEVLASSSPGVIGYSGARKSSAYAATRAAEDAAVKAQKYGVREAKVYIKGPGPGRNSAVKGLSSAGLRITLLSDITPLPHNGCRPRRLPRK